MNALGKSKSPLCIKFEKQPEANYCTLACIRMILKSYGFSVKYNKLKEELSTTLMGTPINYNDQLIGDRLTAKILSPTNKKINARTEILNKEWEDRIIDLIKAEIYPIAHLRLYPLPTKVKYNFGCVEITNESWGHDVIVLKVDKENEKIYFLDPLCDANNGMDNKRCYNSENLPETYISISKFGKYFLNEGARYITIIYNKEINKNYKNLKIEDFLNETNRERMIMLTK